MSKIRNIVAFFAMAAIISASTFGVSYFLKTQQNIDPESSMASEIGVEIAKGKRVVAVQGYTNENCAVKTSPDCLNNKYPITNINDGLNTTFWRNMTDDSTTPARFVIDLEESSKLASTDFKLSWDSGVEYNDGVTFTVSVAKVTQPEMNNPEHWLIINTRRLTAINNGKLFTADLNGATGRFVRFSFAPDGQWSGLGNISEIKVYKAV